MQCVGASAGMLLVVLPAEPSLRGQLHPTVIQQALRVYSGIILQGKACQVGVVSGCGYRLTMKPVM